MKEKLKLMKHFIVKEFVPKEIYRKYGEYSINKIDTRIIITMEQLREYFNQPITINNWYYKGQFNYRGYRPDNYINKATKSYHYFGMAVDFDIKGFNAEEVRNIILLNYERFSYITRMEHIDTKTNTPINWVHIDIAPTNSKGIKLFNI